MMARLKSALQYLAIILLTSVLLWLSLRSLNAVEGQSKFEFLWGAFLKSNKLYLGAMALVALASHVLRAYRWKMLLVPSGKNISLFNSFLSLMVGYLVNLAVPRGGEVSRCYNLYRLEETPVELSFGTVVAERTVDLICLVLLIIISFFVEWEKLAAFMETLNFSSEGFRIPVWVFIALILFLAAIGSLYFFRKNERLRKVIIGFKEGLMGVFRIENKLLFIIMSLAIWGLYFLMSYFVIIAFPETEALGFRAVLTLFAIGSIAMAAPLPGGAGSYHTLVPLGLVMLYNMPKTDAIAFVFVFHAWQTAIMIVLGVVSLVITYLVIRWRKPSIK